jgi:hypothetical protein
MPMDVFLLWHVHKFPDGEEDAKLIGVYSSRDSAEQARRRVGMQPGFRDGPAGFCIDRYTVDEDHWREGYVTESHEDVVRRWQADSAEPGTAADGGRGPGSSEDHGSQHGRRC